MLGRSKSFKIILEFPCYKIDKFINRWIYKLLGATFTWVETNKYNWSGKSLFLE